MSDEMTVEAISHHLYGGGNSRRDPKNDIAFLLKEIKMLRKLLQLAGPCECKNLCGDIDNEIGRCKGLRRW